MKNNIIISALLLIIIVQGTFIYSYSNRPLAVAADTATPLGDIFLCDIGGGNYELKYNTKIIKILGEENDSLEKIKQLFSEESALPASPPAPPPASPNRGENRGESLGGPTPFPITIKQEADTARAAAPPVKSGGLKAGCGQLLGRAFAVLTMYDLLFRDDDEKLWYMVMTAKSKYLGENAFLKDMSFIWNHQSDLGFTPKISKDEIKQFLIVLQNGAPWKDEDGTIHFPADPSLGPKLFNELRVGLGKYDFRELIEGRGEDFTKEVEEVFSQPNPEKIGREEFNKRAKTIEAMRLELKKYKDILKTSYNPLKIDGYQNLINFLEPEFQEYLSKRMVWPKANLQLEDTISKDCTTEYVDRNHRRIVCKILIATEDGVTGKSTFVEVVMKKVVPFPISEEERVKQEIKELGTRYSGIPAFEIIEQMRFNNLWPFQGNSIDLASLKPIGKKYFGFDGSSNIYEYAGDLDIEFQITSKHPLITHNINPPPKPSKYIFEKFDTNIGMFIYRNTETEKQEFYRTPPPDEGFTTLFLMGRNRSGQIRIWDPKQQKVITAPSTKLIYKRDLSNPDGGIYVYEDPAKPGEDIISNVYNLNVLFDPDYLEPTP